MAARSARGTRGFDVVFVVLLTESQQFVKLLMGKTISRNTGAFMADYEGFSGNVL